MLNAKWGNCERSTNRKGNGLTTMYHAGLLCVPMNIPVCFYVFLIASVNRAINTFDSFVSFLLLLLFVQKSVFFPVDGIWSLENSLFCC